MAFIYGVSGRKVAKKKSDSGTKNRPLFSLKSKFRKYKGKTYGLDVSKKGRKGWR